MRDMKNYGYIDKVLSHIRSKNQHKKIEYELLDHLDESSKFYESIGYNEKQAVEKAELAMGDGDVVGEQLDLQLYNSRNRKSAYIFFDLLAAVLSVLFCVLVTMSENNVLDDFYNPDALMILEFGCFIISGVIFSFCLIVLIFAAKRKSVFGLLSGAFSSIYPSMIFGAFIGRAVYWSGQGQSFAKTFYNGCFDTVSESRIMTAVIFLIIGAAFLNGLTVYIKTKRLENTRMDITKTKVMTVILSIIAALSILFVIITAYQTVLIKNQVYNETVKQSKAFCERFVNNMDDFMTTDRNKLIRAFESTFDKEDYKAYELFTDVQYNPADYYSVAAYYDSLNTKVSIEISETLMNPFSASSDNIYGEYLYDLSDRDISDDMSPADAPLPAEISYECSRDTCSIRFNYDEYDLIHYGCAESFLLFTYNFKEKRFELTDSSEFEYDIPVSLSEKQYGMLNQAIGDYNNDDDDYPVNIYSQIYDVNRCEKAVSDHVFKIDLSYCSFRAVSDAGQLKFSQKELYEGVSIIAECNDNEVRIVRIDDYSLVPEQIKNVFSEKAYDAFEKRDLKWYNNALSAENADSLVLDELEYDK